jgi:hypothetical protein
VVHQFGEFRAGWLDDPGQVGPCSQRQIGHRESLPPRTIRRTVAANVLAQVPRCQLSEVVASDTDVKEVVRTMPRRKNDIPPFAQVVRTDMPFRDAVTFEIVVAGLCQLSAVWTQQYWEPLE